MEWAVEDAKAGLDLLRRGNAPVDRIQEAEHVLRQHEAALEAKRTGTVVTAKPAPPFNPEGTKAEVHTTAGRKVNVVYDVAEAGGLAETAPVAAPAVKEPWQMTREEFGSDAWYHGADTEMIGRISQERSLGPSSGWITLDPGVAAEFPKGGKGGAIVVVLGSNRPKTNPKLAGTPWAALTDLTSLRQSAQRHPEKATTLTMTGE
jgi:hypothetical protein